ncbi:alkane 1-monooxygenase [Rhabdobacter roseus]|uniref:Fatty acid desaturase domain-containing protein n=1 Tax=Rhabdobacter roseus TaxID=1655419 RepID=A0A840TQT8_9BACT|nr:fatty acid desaturase [Rhabdobacter roseus]MBB5283902.1 hypothetical protein [Rhabdobacter roseus]
MAKTIFPYTLPLLISAVFVTTAASGWIVLTPLVIFLLGKATPAAGEFSVREVVEAYDFFHHSRAMARFKTLNGIFFVGLNGWSFYFLATHALAGGYLILYIYSLILLNSNFAISLAHDLMHSPRRPDRWLATVLLLQNGFFYLESDHLYIHHRHVGTAQDPASPLLGESVYRYLRRSLGARARLIFTDGGVFPAPKSTRIVRQNVVRLMACLGYLALAFWAGARVGTWVVFQFLFVVLIYESITYIQHYGLRRNRLAAGGYEPVQYHHAWNSFFRLNNYLYFMMPVHSIHHVARPQLAQITHFAGHRMPLPFAQMMLTAYWPARWFALMNERVLRSGQAVDEPTPVL